ncbi:MAG: phytoene/squalene synthase family protein [Lysobacter sp.]|nr:phytoene/squalene synthase family protein [Lysobacter sp.]
MSDPSAADDALDDFLGKWRGRWPEWRIAQVFVAESQRATAEAWFALLQEWTDAAWAGDDPTPGSAKLIWWQEELLGWSKGVRRHPLGRVLQKQPAPWATLAAALPALQAVREPLRAGAEPQTLYASLQPLAVAMADCERALFAPEAAPVADAFALLAAHALWHRDEAAAATRIRDWARGLAAATRLRAGSRPRRIHDTLSRARLQRLATRGEVSALSPMAALWRSWRAARG